MLQEECWPSFRMIKGYLKWRIGLILSVGQLVALTRGTAAQGREKFSRLQEENRASLPLYGDETGWREAAGDRGAAMRVGVLEILRAERSRHWSHSAYAHYFVKQYASVMPQAVSVWCRQMGHESFYATYYGQGDAKDLLPDDLDVVFISTYTQASALAYALAKLFRRDGALTVIGGPHSKSFPDDCRRFFDVVVLDCDKTLVEDILTQAPKGETVTSGRQLKDLPTVEERMPEIEASIFSGGKPYISSTVPMLASIGCPYACDFCIDWSNPFTLLPLDRLEADLRFIFEKYPKLKVSFHDPNFAVRFDEVFSVLEKIPHGNRSYYIMESSLSILRTSRLEQLRSTGCLYVAPGVESWSAYSNKSGVGSKQADHVKLNQVVDHFQLIREYVPGMQANLMFGLDGDEGDRPAELTKEFMSRAPFVWPTINIPTPFGGTPMYDRYLDEGRILTSMPFAFYYAPHIVTTLKNYDPVTYYEHLVDMYSHMASPAVVMKRLITTPGYPLRVLHALRSQGAWRIQREYKRILQVMKTDRDHRAFHEGRSKALPEYYHRKFEAALGPYAELLSREDRQPLLPSSPAHGQDLLARNPQPTSS